MRSFLITYDLNRPGQDYSGLLKEIKGYGCWAKLSESSYAISTASTPDQVYSHLSQYLDESDTIYVIALHQPYCGRGPKAVNDWLEKFLSPSVAYPSYR
jgi:hypothetical protein